MIWLYKRNYNPIWVGFILTSALLLSFLYFDSYRFYYLEQIQLFRFKWDYFESFLGTPGGISEYCGNFLIQFFQIPLIGPVIATLLCVSIYFITAVILREFRIKGVIWSIIPVLLIVALHQDYLYKLGYSKSLLFSLAFIAWCLSVKNVKIRFVSGLAGFIILYPLTGIFSFLAPAIFLLYEIFFSVNRSKSGFIAGYVLSVLLVPYIYWRYIYYLPFSDAWLSPVPNAGNYYTRITLVILLGYFPLFFIISRLISYKINKPELDLNNGWKNIAGGIIVLGFVMVLMGKFSFDPKAERILKIDYYIQKSDWDKALEQCSQYPEPNRMVVYFTNLSLLKSGHLGDRMFHYNQVGVSGLSLPWAPNNLVPYFGCEIFYHLGYFNEAYRWAFEAMEMNGQCPRLLKRLVMTSLINGDIKLAEKFLRQLNQSLFYRNWSRQYMDLINNPELLNSDKEISENRKLLVQNDFFAGSDDTMLDLKKLLENHLLNKPAFEYYMASLLLKKDIVTFTKEIEHLKEFGYKEIPVHYEEALFEYIEFSKQNVLPQGYNIIKSTIEKFRKYVYTYSSNSNNPNALTGFLRREFGSTYWYYYHFINQ